MLILGRDQFRRECNNITINVDRTGYKTEEKTEIIRTKKCDPEWKNVCHNLTIPKYEVKMVTHSSAYIFY